MSSTISRSPWLVGRVLLLAMAVSGHVTLTVLRRLGLYERGPR